MSSDPSVSSFFVTGGTLSIDDPSYVERRADQELVASLLAGQFCYILTASQMGKSSLMVRTAHRLRQQGTCLALLDLAASGQNVTPEQWYDGLLLRIGQQLHLEDELEDYWVNNPRLGPCQRFFTALREIALPNLSPPPAPASATSHRRPNLVLFLDEIDNVRSLPFPTDELFAAIRECLNHRSQDPELERLTFCLLGIATPADLIKDPYRTPFNIGRRIELTDFSPTEATHFLTGLDRQRLPWIDPQLLLDRILYWTNGHPYLTQQLFRAVTLNPARCGAESVQGCVDRLCDELCLSPRARETNDNLLFVRERILRTDADLVTLLELYERILNNREVLDDDHNREINQLRLAGLARTHGRQLAVRNRIYQEVFNHAWVSAVKPIAELETPDGKRHRIRANFTIGRTDANDLVLPDIKVSRRHALIQKQAHTELLLVDLGSRNGTHLNGRRIVAATLLRNQDRIEIGPHSFLFHQPNAPRRDPGDQTTLDRTVLSF
jgi:hypothetical protein